MRIFNLSLSPKQAVFSTVLLTLTFIMPNSKSRERPQCTIQLIHCFELSHFYDTASKWSQPWRIQLKCITLLSVIYSRCMITLQQSNLGLWLNFCLISRRWPQTKTFNKVACIYQHSKSYIMPFKYIYWEKCYSSETGLILRCVLWFLW